MGAHISVVVEAPEHAWTSATDPDNAWLSCVHGQLAVIPSFLAALGAALNPLDDSRNIYGAASMARGLTHANNCEDEPLLGPVLAECKEGCNHSCAA